MFTKHVVRLCRVHMKCTTRLQKASSEISYEPSNILIEIKELYQT